MPEEQAVPQQPDDTAKQLCRPVSWSEITLEQKVERMRAEVKRMQFQLATLQNGSEQMRNHVHADGHIAYKCNHMPLGEGGLTQSGIDQYF